MSKGRCATSTVVLIAAAAFASLAPSAQASHKPKPKPTKTQIANYSDDVDMGVKTFYKGKTFLLKGECIAPSATPELTFVARKDGVTIRQYGISSLGFDASTQAFNLQKGDTAVVGLSDATGETIVTGPKPGDFATITQIFHRQAFGKDCNMDAVVTTVGEKDLLSAATKTTAKLKKTGPLDLSLQCTDGHAAILGSQPGQAANVVAVDHLTDDGIRQTFGPIENNDQVFGPAYDFGDALYYDEAAVVTDYRMNVVGPDLAGGKCSAQGVRIAGKKATFNSVTSAQTPREVIYSEKGLKLSASCSSGELDVYASTTLPGSLFGASAISESGGIEVSDGDFSETEASPFPVLTLQNVARSGQIVYVRPDGKMVALNYVAANSNTSCVVSGASWTA